MVYKLSLVFFFQVFCFAYVTAQKTTMQTVIITAFQDEKVLSSQKMSDFAVQQNFNLPLLRKIDLRLGINGNLTADTLDGGLRNEDYYALQISPNSLRERKAQRAIKNNVISTYKAEQDVWLLQALSDRYNALASLYFNEQQSVLQQDFKALLLQKKEFFQNALRLGVSVKVKDVVEIEREYQNLTQNILLTQNNIGFQKERLSVFLKREATDIAFEKFITSADIQQKLNNIVADSTRWFHPTFLLKEAETNLSFAEYRLESAKEKQILSFVQFGYDNYNYVPAALRRFNPNNNLAFRIGLSAPLSANNNLKKAKAAIQWEDDKQSYENNKIALQKQIRLQVKKVENFVRAVDENRKEMDNNILQKLLDNKTLMAQTPTEDILDIKIILADKKLKNVEQQNSLVIEYLKLLEMTGFLLQNKEKNVLSEE